MRIVSLFVAFCFSLNVMASTGTVQELEKALDHYHYSLSVEWDQKDQRFYDAKTQEFFAKLEKLIKEDGLSQEQMLEVVEKKVNNKILVDAFKLKMSLLGKGASVEELSQMVKESSREMYAQGASWKGELLIPVVTLLIIAALVGYSYYWDATHECVKTESQYTCTTYNSCGAGGTHDPFYVGSPYSCISFPRTICGYVDVCTEYVKK